MKHQWRELGSVGGSQAAVESRWLPADFGVAIRKCTRCGRTELACRLKAGVKREVGSPGLRLRDPCEPDGEEWPNLNCSTEEGEDE